MPEDLKHHLTIAKKIKNYAKSMPDEIYFIDENGQPIEDLNPMVLSDREKEMIASLCVRQKQSIETVIVRALKKSLKNK